MAIIETDIVIALASKKDVHHNEVKKLLEKVNVLLSPYTLIELDLIILSGNLVVKIPDFYDALNDTFRYYNVSILPPDTSHLNTAWLIREKYGLTFFDSLHAATALERKDILISYDKRYAVVKNLKYVHPSSYKI